MGLREDILSGKDSLPRSHNDLRRIFGLPVCTSKWMPDTLIVMGNRGGKTLAQEGWEYAQKMADRQKREEAMPTNEYRNFNISTNSSTVTNDAYLYNPGWNNGTVYVDASVYGDPTPRFLSYTGPLQKEAMPKEETPEAWLKRRVEEICWRPA
jgi:hypothetical protein